MKKPTIRRRLIDAYAFPGFRPLSSVRGVFGDPKARVVTLVRRSKKLFAEVAERVASRGTVAKKVTDLYFPREQESKQNKSVTFF